MSTRFGVVGTSYWAREVHIPGLLGTTGADLVGVWGRTPAPTQAIAERYGIRAFPSFEDLLDAVDAISVAVDPAAQAVIAVAAAEAGKHLILEKPLALDLLSADRVVTAVAAANVASIVFFIRRFIPAIAEVIASERHNRWRGAEVRVHSSVMATDSPYRNSGWRQKPRAALWDIGPHVLSILIPMLGDVVQIEARSSRDHSTTLHTVHEGGGSANVSLTLHSPANSTANSYRFTAEGRELVLPDPSLVRAEVFRVAVNRLLKNVASGERQDECGVGLGAQIVALLAQADRTIS